MSATTNRSGRRGASGRGGYSLIEVLIASAILLLITANVWMVSRAGRSAAESGVFNMSLNDEVNLTYDRISFAIMAANSDDVDGAGVTPVTSSSVEFSSTLGQSDGTIVRGPVERIEGLWPSGPDGRVVWREQAAELAPREVTWSNAVPRVFKGEIDGNGLDDNDNGVTDEGGLGFTKNSHRVDIYVTVERVNSDGKRVAEKKASNVMCRN